MTTKKPPYRRFLWQGHKDSNSGHAVLETAALPAELYPYISNARLFYHNIVYIAIVNMKIILLSLYEQKMCLTFGVVCDIIIK